MALRLLDCSMKCLMKFMTRQEATIGRNSTAVLKLVFCFHMSCFRFFLFPLIYCYVLAALHCDLFIADFDLFYFVFA